MDHNGDDKLSMCFFMCELLFTEPKLCLTKVDWLVKRQLHESTVKVGTIN